MSNLKDTVISLHTFSEAFFPRFGQCPYEKLQFTEILGKLCAERVPQWSSCNPTVTLNCRQVVDVGVLITSQDFKNGTDQYQN